MSKETLGQRIISLIYPIDCLGCGLEGQWLCEDCQKRHRRIRLDGCFICSKVATNGICPKCRKETGLDGIISIFSYSSPEAQALIYQGKYFGYHHALRFIAGEFHSRIIRFLPENIEQVTFVPISSKRRKQRGYNQSEVIAQTLAGDELNVVDLLEKSRETESQTGLTKSKRKKNVRGCLSLKTKRVPESIAIIDDVITTGATLSTAVKLLRRKGVKTIWAITICHG